MPEKGGKRGLSLVRSLGANDANLPCKSRHISRHRTVEGRSRDRVALPPFLARSPAFRSLFSAATMHHSADSPEVDEKFSELLSRELSHRAPATSRKFHDVNAIAFRAADRRTDFRLFAKVTQPGFLRIYRRLFNKLLRKFVNIRDIFSRPRAHY